MKYDFHLERQPNPDITLSVVAPHSSSAHESL